MKRTLQIPETINPVHWLSLSHPFCAPTTQEIRDQRMTRAQRGFYGLRARKGLTIAGSLVAASCERTNERANRLILLFACSRAISGGGEGGKNQPQVQPTQEAAQEIVRVLFSLSLSRAVDMFVHDRFEFLCSPCTKWCKTTIVTLIAAFIWSGGLQRGDKKPVIFCLS